MSDYSPDFLRRLIEAVKVFETAFEAWIATQHEFTMMEARGLWPTVRRKEEADATNVRSLELDVAAAAGTAARGVQVTGAYVMVSGLPQPIDPIANWSLMSQPKSIIEPDLVRTTAANVRGRLAAMLAEAEAAGESGTPGFVPSQLHPVIWAAAADHWTTHRRRVAVREAAEALTNHWRGLLGRHDVDGTTFWEQTLSGGPPEPGRPKLVWPGDDTDKTVKSVRGGTRSMAKALTDLGVGVTLTIRNVSTHTGGELSEQDGLERLAAYSYLARLLDSCEVRRHTDEEAESTGDDFVMGQED
ncbi:MAG: TIGR02391 family protein [Humibacillus sp.]|nr:TIGR02391 family protein [Humibacillus sp.]